MFLSPSQAPHPLYQPNNDLVVCKDPLCAALHPPGDYRCENPEQCDYEVEYADGGSSLGVLVRDVFSLNYINGIRFSPRLALGLVPRPKLSSISVILLLSKVHWSCKLPTAPSHFIYLLL